MSIPMNLFPANQPLTLSELRTALNMLPAEMDGPVVINGKHQVYCMEVIHTNGPTGLALNFKYYLLGGI